jgi:hypothetical protein
LNEELREQYSEDYEVKDLEMEEIAASTIRKNSNDAMCNDDTKLN